MKMEGFDISNSIV